MAKQTKRPAAPTEVWMEWQDRGSELFWYGKVDNRQSTSTQGRLNKKTWSSTFEETYRTPAAAARDLAESIEMGEEPGTTMVFGPEAGERLAKALGKLSGSERHTVRMELVDTLCSGTELFVVAGYPHPTNDWGWDSWERDGRRLNDSNWNSAWDNTFWHDQVMPEPDDVGGKWSDVELEYDHTRVLVRTKNAWDKQALPLRGTRLRELPTIGICVLGRGNICVRRAAGWVEGKCSADVRDVGADRTGQLLGVGASGLGQITFKAKSLAWKPLPGPAGHQLCVTPHGTLVAGPGLHLRDGTKYETITKAEGVLLAAEPDLDGTTVAISAAGDLWELTAAGINQTRVKRAAGGFGAIARYRGVNYVTRDKHVMRIRSGTLETIALPVPKVVVGKTLAWPRNGATTLRVSGGKLWATCDHHIAVTTTGKQWELVAFR